MMSRFAWPRLGGILPAALAAAGLTACSGNMDELEFYIDEIKSRPGGAIEPIPTPRPEPSFVYEADSRRPPFTPDEPTSVASRVAGNTPVPDPNRPREPLEDYPLDSLRMVGNLELNGRMVGLIEDSDGYVNQVVAGNYMGQNHGRVVSITQSEIELVELHNDGQGAYVERPARISLSDN